MTIRKGYITWKRSNKLADLRCLFGIHNGWRRDVYINDGTPFTYCPNCHQERVPDFYTPLDIPPVDGKEHES